MSQGQPQRYGDRGLADAVLVRCAICGAEGPRALLQEHYDYDHRVHAKERGDVFMPRVPTRFRALLTRVSLETGCAPSRLVAIALERYYGCYEGGRNYESV